MKIVLYLALGTYLAIMCVRFAVEDDWFWATVAALGVGGWLANVAHDLNHTS